MFFDLLPYEILFTILSQYCNGMSLSVLINVCHNNNNEFLKSIIIKSLETKLSILSKNGIFPRRNVLLPYQFRSTLELADELQLNDNISIDTNDVDDDDDDNNNLRSISDRLLIVSFFEDYELQIKTPVHVEIPLWCGNLHISNIIPKTTKNISILVLTPISSWHHELVHEWSTFSEYGLILYPRPRNAYPLPPIARIKGVTKNDTKVLLVLAKYMDNTNQVLVQGYCCSSSPMNIIIMSRKQVLTKLSQNNIISSHVKNKIMSTLNYEYDHLNNKFRMITTTTTTIPSRTIDDDISSSSFQSNELFAFIEVPPFETSTSSLTIVKNEVMNIRKTYEKSF